MNLNEECLLQFLKNEGALLPEASAFRVRSGEGAMLPAVASDLHRILRRDRFVSFPPALVARRPLGEPLGG